MSDEEVDALLADLHEDGIQVTREEAKSAVERLARLLLLISAPLPEPFASLLEEDQTAGQDALPVGHDQ